MNVFPHLGAVLYFWNDHLDAAYPHWHIILNCKSVDGEGSHVAICTSHCERYRAMIAKGLVKEETVVFIPQSDYIEFTAETAVNCHKIDFITDEELKQIAAQKDTTRFRQCRNFPQACLTKIINGVLLSREHDDVIRAALLGVPVQDVPDAMFRRFGMKLKEHLPSMYAKVSAKNTYVPPKGGISIVVTPNPT